MPFSAGSGFSYEKDAFAAITEAYTQAKQELNGEVKFIQVYFTVYYPIEELEAAFSEVFGDIPNYGCSGEGVIGKNAVVEGSEPGISITVFSGNRVRFHTQVFENLGGRDEEVGVEINKWMREKKKLKALIVLPDAVTCNFSFLIKGIEKDFGFFNRIPVIGGLAADDLDLQSTYQLHNNRIYKNSIVALALCGKFKYGHAVNHGCTPTSKAYKVTKAEDNIIYELDGKPALDVIFEHSVDEEAKNWVEVSINMCLAIKAPSEIRENYDEFIVRFMVNCDTEKKSIGMSANIEEGTDVWIARRNLDKIDEGMLQLASDIKKQLKNKNQNICFILTVAEEAAL